MEWSISLRRDGRVILFRESEKGLSGGGQLNDYDTEKLKRLFFGDNYEEEIDKLR